MFNLEDVILQWRSNSKVDIATAPIIPHLFAGSQLSINPEEKLQVAKKEEKRYVRMRYATHPRPRLRRHIRLDCLLQHPIEIEHRPVLEPIGPILVDGGRCICWRR